MGSVLRLFKAVMARLRYGAEIDHVQNRVNLRVAQAVGRGYIYRHIGIFKIDIGD